MWGRIVHAAPLRVLGDASCGAKQLWAGLPGALGAREAPATPCVGVGGEGRGTLGGRRHRLGSGAGRGGRWWALLERLCNAGGPQRKSGRGFFLGACVPTPPVPFAHGHPLRELGTSHNNGRTSRSSLEIKKQEVEGRAPRVSPMRDLSSWAWPPNELSDASDKDL